MQMNLLVNEDVLSMIMYNASTPTVAAMMRTCNPLYHEGAKTLLARGVTLRTDSSIIAFLRFLLKHGGLRIKHFRELTISAVPSSTTAEFFALTLQSVSPSITTLRITDVSEETLFSHPDIAIAFSALRTVQALTVAEAGKRTMGMIRRMRSPLSRVRITFPPRWRLNVAPNFETMHPVTALQSVRVTLQALFVDWLFDEEQQTYPVASFPSMQELRLDHLLDPSIGPFITAFPNLSTLQANSAYDSDDSQHYLGDVEPDVLHIAVNHRRAENQAFQAVHGTWEVLDHFTGTVLSLYVLGLVCKIHTLDLTMKNEPYEWFAAILNDTRPSTVWLSIHDTDAVGSMLPDELAQRGAGILKDLDMCCQMAAVDSSIGMPSLLVSPPASFAVQLIHG